ncbi:phosphotransferase [Sphaerisporangium sp. NPDC051011]|uniref:phosphotransferase enzyme family protein n=1 Tax=Sphaerisporangium sp. NPDC051011 TaxID=3155792 RepID=UPI0033E35860
MELHDLSGGDEVLSRVGLVARRALPGYGMSPEARVTLLNVSENATFLVEDQGARTVLRVHRLGYHSPEAILSELDWQSALGDEAGVRTPAVLAALDGSRVVTVEDPGAAPRNCVMFEWVPGAEPPEERLVEHFEPLGAITARMHLHARRWRRPAAFTRFAWDEDAAFGPAPRWGRWQDGVGVDREAHEVLARLESALRDRLARYGKGPERFGLIHADMRLANLLVDGTAGTTVIDFDDCGISWYMYDLGAAVSFIEHHPKVPEMIDAWVRGYRTVHGLSADDEREIWTFVMFRRLLLLAWIGSHSAADVARELGTGYTLGSCELAERYLSGSL